MKKITLIVSACAVVMALASCGKSSKGGYAIDSQKVTLHNTADSLSWVLGEQLGKQFAQTLEFNRLSLNTQVMEQAFCNALENAGSPIDQESAERIYRNFTIMAAQNMHSSQQSQSNTAAQQEEQFFQRLIAENPNVKRHESGIYYEVLQQGKGRNCKYGDRISFDYKGYLLTTQELFDQTYGQREPIIHVVGKPMFQGLLDGLQLMNAGSIYKLYIPNQLAFGAQGTEHIPPYTGVIYEVELHEIFNN